MANTPNCAFQMCRHKCDRVHDIGTPGTYSTIWKAALVHVGPSTAHPSSPDFCNRKQMSVSLSVWLLALHLYARLTWLGFWMLMCLLLTICDSNPCVLCLSLQRCLYTDLQKWSHWVHKMQLSQWAPCLAVYVVQNKDDASLMWPQSRFTVAFNLQSTLSMQASLSTCWKQAYYQSYSPAGLLALPPPRTCNSGKHYVDTKSCWSQKIQPWDLSPHLYCCSWKERKAEKHFVISLDPVLEQQSSNNSTATITGCSRSAGLWMICELHMGL